MGISFASNVSYVCYILDCFKRNLKMGRQFELDENNSDHIIVIININGKGDLMAKEKVIIYGKGG